MIIDAYAHDVPRDFYDEMGRVYPTESHANHPNIGGFFDYDRRLNHLDEFGIDKQVIALGGPHFWPGIDPEDAAPLVELANDEIRAVADEYPDRYIPIGTIPVIYDGMIDEVRRCIDDLDMAGVQLYSNYEGVYPDDEAFHQLYELADRKGFPVWLHPQHHPGSEVLDEYVLNLLFGWPFDTTLALTRLVMSGVLERYSDLQLVAHHGAAMIPHFFDRITTVYGGTHEPTFDYAFEELTKPPQEYFEQFYVDSVMYGSVAALNTVYQVFGADHLLFATDYPYGGDAGRENIRENVETMDAFDLPESERRQVMSENVSDLLGL